jgi:hypothetical protein
MAKFIKVQFCPSTVSLSLLISLMTVICIVLHADLSLQLLMLRVETSRPIPGPPLISPLRHVGGEFS